MLLRNKIRFVWFSCLSFRNWTGGYGARGGMQQWWPVLTHHYRVNAAVGMTQRMIYHLCLSLSRLPTLGNLNKAQWRRFFAGCVREALRISQRRYFRVIKRFIWTALCSVWERKITKLLGFLTSCNAKIKNRRKRDITTHLRICGRIFIIMQILWMFFFALKGTLLVKVKTPVVGSI